MRLAQNVGAGAGATEAGAIDRVAPVSTCIGAGRVYRHRSDNCDCRIGTEGEAGACGEAGFIFSLFSRVVVLVFLLLNFQDAIGCKDAHAITHESDT